jgi:putative ABC transport system permease protein
MQFPEVGNRSMEVAGIFQENRIAGDYVVGLGAYRTLFASDLGQFLMLKSAPGTPLSEARRAVDRVVEDFPNVKVRDQAELREEQERQVDQLLGLVTALLALAIVIALLGIVNTLALSVIERTRELGLLRAVGLSRRQTRSMVRWESVIIALFGGVLGLGVGALFGCALVAALADEGLGELAFPMRRLVVFLALAGIAGILAAVGPARRAARLNVLEAIATE